MVKNRPCKLMRSNDTTMWGTRWGDGATNTITRGGWELCTSDLFHYYDHPLLAAFFDLMHGEYGENAILRTCKAQGRTVSDGTKRGTKILTTEDKIKLPIITIDQRVEIAVRVSLLLVQPQEYIAWANKWLDGADRCSVVALGAATNATAIIRAAYPVRTTTPTRDIPFVARVASDIANAIRATVADVVYDIRTITRAAPYAAYAAYYTANAAAYTPTCTAYEVYNGAVDAANAVSAAIRGGISSCVVLDIIDQVVNKEEQ